MKTLIMIDAEPTVNIRVTDVDCHIKGEKPIKDYQIYSNKTLKEAVIPLKQLIPGLDDYVRRTKSGFNKHSLDDLTDDESAAIYLYTMQADGKAFSHLLNEALRHEDQTTVREYWLMYLTLLWSALNKLPAVRGLAYQGINKTVRDVYSQRKIITWCGITSCTPTPDAIASSMLGKKATLLKIKIRNGRDISAYSCNAHEIEWVLLPGARLQLKNTSYNANLQMEEIYLEEIDEEASSAQIMQQMTTRRTSKDESCGKKTIVT